MAKKKSASTGRKIYQGQKLIDFKNEVKLARKMGLVSKKVDLRKLKATSYRRKQINALRPVLLGLSIAVPAPKQIRDKYSGSEYKTSGPFIIVKKTRNEAKAKINERGLLEISNPMTDGNMIEIVLPIRINSLASLVETLQTDDTFGGLREGYEQYGFRLNGHNAKGLTTNGIVFAEYIENNYKHILNDEFGGEKVISFRLFRVEATKLSDEMPRSFDKKYYGKTDASGRSVDRYFYDRDSRATMIRQNKWRLAKKQQRKHMSPEQKQKHNEYMRNYMKEKRVIENRNE